MKPQFIEKTDLNSSLKDLENQQLDLILLPLVDIPFGSFYNTSIAALSNRTKSIHTLVIPSHLHSRKYDFQLQKNSSLTVSSELIRSQMSYFRPDLRIEVMDQSDLSSAIETSMTQTSFIVNKEMIESTETDYIHFDLSPKEIVPMPGTGTWALVCNSENIELRKSLTKIHNKHTAICTNIERKVSKAFDNNVGVYCEKDLSDNYHIYGVRLNKEKNQLVRKELSYSTTVNLAEDLILHLK